MWSYCNFTLSFARFTPEQLGITASSALVWLFVEIMAILFSMYICNVQAEIKWLDLLAFCGYKYFGWVLKWEKNPFIPNDFTVYNISIFLYAMQKKLKVHVMKSWFTYWLGIVYTSFKPLRVTLFIPWIYCMYDYTSTSVIALVIIGVNACDWSRFTLCLATITHLMWLKR